MGTGPGGSGVTIVKPDPIAPRESYAERQLRARQDRRARLDAHAERERAFAAEQEGKALVGSPENKMLPGPPENKAVDPERAPEHLEAQSKATLLALAEERGVTVTRADGRTDLGPTKADYVRALGA